MPVLSCTCGFKIQGKVDLPIRKQIKILRENIITLKLFSMDCCVESAQKKLNKLYEISYKN